MSVDPQIFLHLCRNKSKDMNISPVGLSDVLGPLAILERCARQHTPPNINSWCEFSR